MIKKADRPSKRKKKDAVYDKDGNMFCPHCNTKIEGNNLELWRYGKSENEFWYKYICPTCGHYIMTYRDSKFNILRKNIMKEDENIG